MPFIGTLKPIHNDSDPTVSFSLLKNPRLTIDFSWAITKIRNGFWKRITWRIYEADAGKDSLPQTFTKSIKIENFI